MVELLYGAAVVDGAVVCARAAGTRRAPADRLAANRRNDTMIAVGRERTSGRELGDAQRLLTTRIRSKGKSSVEVEKSAAHCRLGS